MRSCSAKASLIFSTKNISVFGYKVVKHLTSWSLNELVKLTMLWTTGALDAIWFADHIFNQIRTQDSHTKENVVKLQNIHEHYFLQFSKYMYLHTSNFEMSPNNRSVCYVLACKVELLLIPKKVPVLVHKAFQYYPSTASIWLKYCWKCHKITRYQSIHDEP